MAVETIALGGDVSDAGNFALEMERPYLAAVRITGDAAILWHRWQSDAVEVKAAAAKGSKAKKTDQIETYVFRDQDGTICLPGEYLRCSLIDPRNGAAKYQQDPRSPRKSALDLFRAGIVSMTDLAPITRSDGTLASAWDYVDRRRVTVQRSSVTRERPALSAGWSCTVLLQVLTPQYIDPILLRQTLVHAGRLVGVGDFRPTFGRFTVTGFDVID